MMNIIRDISVNPFYLHLRGFYERFLEEVLLNYEITKYPLLENNSKRRLQNPLPMIDEILYNIL